MAARKPPLDYYEILGLPRNATQGDIGAAFRLRVLAIRDQPGAGEETRRINLAYRALSDPERRAVYDETLIRPHEPVASPEPETADPPSASPPEETFFHADDDPPEPSGKGRSRLIAAVLAILLLLFAGAWASGLLRSDPEIASTTGGGTDANAAVVSGNPQPEGGGSALGDVLAALTGRQEQPDAPEPLAPPVETASVADPGGPATVRTIVSDNGVRSAAEAAEEVATSPAAEPAEPPANTELEPAPPPVEEPTRPAAQSDTPPSPAPALVDRTSGPRLIRGGLYDSDNRGGRYQGTVGVRIAVGADGRPQGCRVVRSSGNEGLDLTTCQLLQQRLLFSPARDRSGTPVQTIVESTHVWGSRPRR